MKLIDNKILFNELEVFFNFLIFEIIQLLANKFVSNLIIYFDRISKKHIELPIFIYDR